jgi:hypothetical protein
VATAHLCVHDRVSRGKGGSIVKTAAYNARCRLVDEQTGEVWDYSHLGGHLGGWTYAKTGPDWVNDLQRLVNEIERAEKRCDAQLAINLDIALPCEQTTEQNRRLMQDFVREEFMRHGYVCRADMHQPDPEADPRNIHFHLWASLRKIGPDGFARTKGEQQDNYRNRTEFVEHLRQKWEQLANRHLERNGYDARIDMRSLKDQGIDDRDPAQHKGPTVTTMERENRDSRVVAEIGQRQQDLAKERALKAEDAKLAAAEKRIEAEIIDLQRAREQRRANRYGNIRPGEAKSRARDFDIAGERTTGPGQWDRDAADAAWIKAVEASALAKAQGRAEPAQKAQEGREHGRATNGPAAENARTDGPQRGPLNKTAGDIHIAFSLARTAEQLTEALAARGLAIAAVSADEAYESERKRAFAKEIGNRAPVYRADELVVVNSFGSIYRLDERTTGQPRAEIDKKLVGLNPADLMNVKETKEALQEAALAAFAEERERAKPATALEQKIIDCVREARRDGFDATRDGETVHLTGAAAVAASIDKAGIAVVRVTIADEKAVETLRADEDEARLAAKDVQARRSQRFDQVKAGEVAAVDRFGNVHSLNRFKLDLADLERTLIEAQQTRNGDGEKNYSKRQTDRLPSVTEARAAFEERSERAASRRTETAEQYRADAYERAMWRGDGRKGPSRAAEKDQGVKSSGDIGSKLLGGIGGMLSKLADALASMIAPAPSPTKAQWEDIKRGAAQQEEHEARVVRPAAEQEARFQELREQARREASRQREQRARGKGRDEERDDDIGRSWER